MIPVNGSSFGRAGGRLRRYRAAPKTPGEKIPREAAGQSGCAGVKLRQQIAFVGKRQGPVMKGVELYAQVRYAVQIDGLSRREAARRYGIDPRTVAKMLALIQQRGQGENPSWLVPRGGAQGRIAGMHRCAAYRARAAPRPLTHNALRMSDKPEKVATIECTVCGAFLEVYRRRHSGRECVDWHTRGTELCRDPPLHRCSQARLEVRRRFPDELP